jgi:hypothetical protein
MFRGNKHFTLIYRPDIVAYLLRYIPRIIPPAFGDSGYLFTLTHFPSPRFDTGGPSAGIPPRGSVFFFDFDFDVCWGETFDG